VLTAYVDGLVEFQLRDGTYTSGGFGLRHDNTDGFEGVSSRFDVLRWSPK
jgi:hypothetical protein